MEIYTADLINIAYKYADKIEEKLKENNEYKGYVVTDECCNLAWELRKTLYERFSKAFNDLVFRSKTEGIDLHTELFKMINDL